jgi:hypothetical protein
MTLVDPKKKLGAVSLLTIADLIVFPALFLALRFLANSTLNYYYPGFWRSVPMEGYTSWFLSDVPIGPGKFSFWLASLLSPYFSGPTFGALIITAVAYAVRFFTVQVMRRFKVRKLSGLAYLPVFCMFLQFYYLVNPLPQSIAIIFALGAFHLYQMSDAIGPKLRGSTFFALACTVLMIGGESFFVFAVLCIAFEGAIRRRYLAAATFGALTALLPAIATKLFYPFNSIGDTYRHLMPTIPRIVSFIAMAPFAFWLFFLCIPIMELFEKPLGTSAMALKKNKIPALLSASNSAYRGILLGITACLLAYAVIRWDHEPLTQARSNAVLNLGMVQGNWSAVLEESKKIPLRYLTDSKIHVIDRALFHQGRLLEDLFVFPQNQNALLLFPYSGTARSLGPSDRFWTTVWASPTYFELGMVNTAEHCALEATSEFYYPEGLRLLSMIYAVKEMHEASRACLRALKRDRVYRAWADTCVRVISLDEKAFPAPEVLRARANGIQAKFILSDKPPLSILVKENPANRMAFEYLIASFLIGRNLDSIALYTGRLRELQYSKIPRCVEEALLLYSFLTEKTPELFGFTVSQESMESFERFCSILYTRHGGRAGEALQDLSVSFAESYFFYYVYGALKTGADHDKN